MFYGTEDPRRDAEVIVQAEILLASLPVAPTPRLQMLVAEYADSLAFGLTHPGYVPIVARLACAMDNEVEKRGA